MAPPVFSVVIPAHNEERWIAGCLESVWEAQKQVEGAVECIVVLNACTDGTERVAAERGARIARCDARNLAAIRNAGAREARGEVLITIDADSRMAPMALAEVRRALESGRFVGGGVPLIAERCSAGILLTGVVIMSLCLAVGVPSAGMFWCYKHDFLAVGGFDERLHSGEDVEFARRLKRHGQTIGKRYGTLRRAPIRTSCRKFDQFGDWCFIRLILRHPRACWRTFRGRDAQLANRYWYRVGR